MSRDRFSGTPRIFLSYARKDGEEFATRLRNRLQTEQPEIVLWQDRIEMEGGVGWWKRPHWAPIFSLVPTVRIDTGRRAPAVTGIVRAAWPPKAGNG
jgi:hypothetical protein